MPTRPQQLPSSMSTSTSNDVSNSYRQHLQARTNSNNSGNNNFSSSLKNLVSTTTSSPSHQLASNPLMSAAAAAAIIIQAATSAGSSTTGNDSGSSDSRSLRHCSTTSLNESPQSSPPFSSSVMAVAHLAALESANSTIASVLRRRSSSTIRPLSAQQVESSSTERRPYTVDPAFTDPRFVTALEALTPRLFDQNSFISDHQQSTSYPTNSSSLQLSPQAFNTAADANPYSAYSMPPTSAADTSAYNSTYPQPGVNNNNNISGLGNVYLDSAMNKLMAEHQLNRLDSAIADNAANIRFPHPSSSPLSYSSLSDGTASKGPLSPNTAAAVAGFSNKITSSSLLAANQANLAKYSDSLLASSAYEIKSDGSMSTVGGGGTGAGGSFPDQPGKKREQRLMKNREAARECRRKKKEYVKCLEARVNILESQNQRLIEELQKVKALCFSELCLGMSTGSADMAAALVASSASPSVQSAVAAGLQSAYAPAAVAPPPLDNVVKSKRGARRGGTGSSSSASNRSSLYQPADSSLLLLNDSTKSESFDDPTTSNQCIMTEPNTDPQIYISSSPTPSGHPIETPNSVLDETVGSNNVAAVALSDTLIKYSPGDGSQGPVPPPPTSCDPLSNPAYYQHPRYAAKRRYSNLTSSISICDFNPTGDANLIETTPSVQNSNVLVKNSRMMDDLATPSHAADMLASSSSTDVHVIVADDS